jgi:DNA-binding FadR family transcriptional regulator
MTSGALTPVHVPKAAELVAQALRARVLSRELVPGDRLPPESALVAQYGVSRPTLREALRLLEAQELLEVRRGAHGGAVVRRPSTRPAADAIALWLMLGQPAATRLPDAWAAQIAAAVLDEAAAAAALRMRRKRRAA